MEHTEIILVRHGETVWNLENRYQGQLDSPLTERGMAQARAIAARLERCAFDCLYASDLGRAWKTAEAVARSTGHEIIPEPRLRERNFGIFQGLNRADMRGQYPEEYQKYTADYAAYVVLGGESLDQFSARAVTCLEELVDRHAGGRVVLVSHGGAMAAMVKHVLGIAVAAPRPFRLFNAGYNLIARDGDSWTLEILGDVSHLREGGLDDDTA